MSKPFNEANPRENFEMEPGDWGFHGDVIIECVKSVPAEFSSFNVVKDDCLAYGEATGHLHQLFGEDGSFELREDPKTKVKHLRVVTPTYLKHQEHSPVLLKEGDYKINIQREYDPFSKLIRRVID